MHNFFCASFRMPAAALLAAALLICGCGGEPDAAPGRPDRSVLVIVADALRADSLGCYGQSAPTSPNIDGLAAEGALFEECRTVVPATLPSFITLLTSLHPKDHGASGNGFPPANGLVYLGDAARGAGYETAFFASSFCVTSLFGTSQGFDHFDENLDSTAVLPFNKTIRTASSVTSSFLEWFEQRDGKKPFFAVVHYFDPHIPFVPPQEYAAMFLDDEKGPLSVDFRGIMKSKNDLKKRGGKPGENELRYRDLYRAEVRYMDAEIGKIVRALDRSDEGARTIVVFTADHGQTLWDHDEYFNHTRQVYDSNIRIPLIFRAPGFVPQGRYNEPSFSNLDLAPTLLGLAGAAIPGEFAGRDLHCAVLGEKVKIDSSGCFFSEAEKFLSKGGKPVRPNYLAAKCVMKGSWKYIWTPHRENLEELYNVAADPQEKNNLAAAPEHAALVEELQGRLRAWAAEFAARPRRNEEIPPDALERLKALGYGR